MTGIAWPITITGMSRVLLAVLLHAVLAVPVHADLRTGNDKFLHGDYDGAVEQYKATKGKDAPLATLRLGRVYLRTGDLVAAESAAKAAAKGAGLAADAKVLLAEIHRATGRYSEARKLLEEVTKRSPGHLRARCQLGLLYHYIGETSLAAKVLDQFFDDFNDGTIDQGNAEQLMNVAQAARVVGSYQDATDAFRDAVRLDPNLLEANIEWGWLFLEKYAAGYAEQSFDEVLKIDPRHPDAHAGMARVKLEQSYDVKGAIEHIEKALAINSKHAAALAIRAEIEIGNQQHEDARKTLAAVLSVNPSDIVARSLLATVHWLRDDLAQYEAEKKKVLAIHPRPAQFFHLIADFAVKEHRYRESILLEEEALKLDPKFHAALAGIGIGHLRMGEEAKGLEYLNKAFDGDPFNVRTYNMLNLFDDVIPKDYEILRSKHFRFRVTKAEKPLLERYLPRLLEKAFVDMEKRYGFSPETPVTVELFADPQHFSVRTMGLPNLGAIGVLGVCFGKVITAISPISGNVNWGMVLWHELGHVFAIQLSRSRVPRWFTEGLSEYETIMARPEWRRENDVDLWLALSSGQLPSVVQLDSMFLPTGGMQNVVVAYHLSSVAVQFIATKWGFPKVVQALKLFGQGKGTAAVIKEITGLDTSAFDRELRAYLEKRLAPYRGTFAVQLSKFGDVTELEKVAAARPQDAEAAADLALGYLVNDEPDKAAATAEKALSLDPKSKKALFTQAELALQRKDSATTRAKLLALIAAGGDGFMARVRLGAIAVESKDLKEATAQLTQAKKLDPERSEPYELLARAYAQANREDDAIKELERYVTIEEMVVEPVKKLVGKHLLRKNWAKVREFGEMALLIDPYDLDIHLALGESYVQLGALDDAIWEYENALKSDPPPKRPAVVHVGLAKAYSLKGDGKRARKALEAALVDEPQNAEALELLKKLPKPSP
ncbi:MAG: tetratricopeptide repeat protein [Deltaproteobacteria bacterium]|nr:tetratricopeptide repeat protein [Deltaproteobacteria bacterium]